MIKKADRVASQEKIKTYTVKWDVIAIEGPFIDDHWDTPEQAKYKDYDLRSPTHFGLTIVGPEGVLRQNTAFGPAVSVDMFVLARQMEQALNNGRLAYSEFTNKDFGDVLTRYSMAPFMDSNVFRVASQEKLQTSAVSCEALFHGL